MTIPFVTCLCPTYGRPQLLEQSVAMFVAQDYPAHRRELLIFDDSPNDLRPNMSFPNAPAGQVRYIPFEQRFSSMPEKYNRMIDVALGDVLVVWDDDDEYRPWHVSAHVATLQHFDRVRMSKPSRVHSDYNGPIEEEDASGRFHGSIAFRRGPLWPETDLETFDQMMIAALGIPGDTLLVIPKISYCFKWHTNHYHMQHAMGHSDWYSRMPNLIR